MIAESNVSLPVDAVALSGTHGQDRRLLAILCGSLLLLPPAPAQLAPGRRTPVPVDLCRTNKAMRGTAGDASVSLAAGRVPGGELRSATGDGVSPLDPETVALTPGPPPQTASVLPDPLLQPNDRPSRLPPWTLEIAEAALGVIGPLHIRLCCALVPPPLSRTGWSLTLAAACILGAALFLWRLRVSRLQSDNELQHAFSRLLIASQESERKRIAAELHDELGQQLVVIRNLALISLREGATAVAVHRQLEEISERALLALGEVKKIAYNLRPYQIDRLGLTKAIEGVVKQAAASTSISFAGEIDAIDNVFGKDSEINLYRIVQECVNNLVKHSNATSAGVSVRRGPGELTLAVWDNGRGFLSGDSRAGAESSGYGLLGISERAHLLGGRLAIHSEPGSGTRITVRVPLGGEKG